MRNTKRCMGLFEEFYKILYRDFCIFKDAFKSPAVNFSVVRDNQGDLLGRVKEFYVTTALANFCISCPQKGVNNFIAGKQRRFHIARLRTLWDEFGRISFGLGSKYSRIASLIFLIASFSFLPWLWQPGSEGTLATMYPSSPFSSMILTLIFITSWYKYTIPNLRSQGKFRITPFHFGGGRR